ncbi:MAG: MerR family transcriptional regulator [Anaerolineae bacterium]|nr:MerR family transcriptional regulator [Anaerolineae bacterium]
MFKIGDFSKICQVSIRVLRHWDEMGLLKPGHTDASTGYRYYAIEQLERVNRILALRGLGLSLPQIVRLLEEQVSVSEIRGMLRLKQAELQQQMEASQAMLARVEVRLQQIEHQGAMPDYDVVLKSAQPQRVVSTREVTPDMHNLVDLILETDTARLKHRDHAGALFAVFHDDCYDEQRIDIEIGFSITSESSEAIPLPRGSTLKTGELAGVKLMACTIHQGEWMKLAYGYAALGLWIDTNGYQISGAGRELFHHIGLDDQHYMTVTELQLPIVKVENPHENSLMSIT